ncbi:MAG: hypothetical protein ABI134_00190 [Byssovorax sp.]
MANQQGATGPERLGGAQPPSSGGYGDTDTSPQRVGESDAPDVNPQEPRDLEGLSGMNPPAAVRPDEREDRSEEQTEPGQRQAEGGEPVTPAAPGTVSAEENDPEDPGDRVEGQSLATDGLDG